MQKLTRRHVIATMTSSAVTLCPAILKAQTTADLSSWSGTPTTEPIGQDQLITLAAGPAEVDITALGAGEVAVIARPSDSDDHSSTGMTQYVGVLRRTVEQVAYGAANDRDGTVMDENYLVVELTCPHRGKAVGITGDPNAPFACTDRGNRHSSDFDASGMGVAGASKGDPMVIPAYSIAVGSKVVLTLA